MCFQVNAHIKYFSEGLEVVFELCEWRFDKTRKTESGLATIFNIHCSVFKLEPAD